MRYLLKQKLFSLGDDFTIQDTDGRDAFFVDGKALSLGAKLSFQDMAGNELAFIKQQLLSWGPKYEVFRNGELAAVVTKDVFTLFHCTFHVDVPGPDDLVAEGDFLDHEYVFRRGDTPAATVSKQWFTWADTYGVDIAPHQDDVLLLASTVVIDMACHGDHKRH
ncbi:MAG: LURP-one-related family protein [bacterium]